MASALGASFVAAAVALGVGSNEHTWPSTHYQADPLAFFRNVLGVEPWSRQVEVIEAVRDYPRVAVASGHKVSKSHTAAGIALWFYSSFADARVVMTSVTSRQVDAILWRELRMMRSRGQSKTGVLIDGNLAQLARSGLKSADFREVVGFTAKDAEAVAGISGANLLYILDEASGIPDKIFEAIEGNRAGGARVVMFSNPTRTTGEFFDAFHKKQDFYKTIQISSEETPNVIEGRAVIPGLAERGWIDEKRKEWGEDSPLYKVRIKGEFCTTEDGKIVSLHDIAMAEARWHDLPAEGRLHIGIDPAGPGDGGDETVFAIRRGLKILELRAFRSLTESQILTQGLAIASEFREGREQRPLFVIDREGPIGSRVFGLFRAREDNAPETLQVMGVRASDRAYREPHIYDRCRDEIWANTARWITKEGGSIPEDTKLSRELHCPEWEAQLSGKLKASSKDKMKKELGRSPDRADAVALAVWPAGAVAEYVVSEPERQQEDHAAPPQRVMNPYAAMRTWGRG